MEKSEINGGKNPGAQAATVSLRCIVSELSCQNLLIKMDIDGGEVFAFA